MTNPQFPVGAPSWVDIGTTDIPGTIDFYGQLFGWTYLDYGPDAMGYGAFLKDGKQAAGIGQATDPERGTSWATYLMTNDVDTTVARVQAGGGTVIVEPMEVMGQGKMAVFTDPAGAFFSVWEPGLHHGVEVFGVAGALVWADLMTNDLDGAKSFYSNVFGLSAKDGDGGDGTKYTVLEADGKGVAGAMQNQPEWGPMPSQWSVYFAVDDVDAAADRAVELGATDMMRKDSPAGRFATLQDPQGGVFSVFKPDPSYQM